MNDFELRIDQIADAGFAYNKLQIEGKYSLNKPSGYGKTMVAYDIMKKYRTVIYCVRENPYKFYIMDELIKYGCDRSTIDLSVGYRAGSHRKLNNGGCIFIMHVEEFIRLKPLLTHNESCLLVLDDLTIDFNERGLYHCLTLETSVDCKLTIKKFNADTDEERLKSFDNIIKKYKRGCKKIIVNLDNIANVSKYVEKADPDYDVYVATTQNSYSEIMERLKCIDNKPLIIISINGVLNSTLPVVTCDLLILSDTYINTRGCQKVVQILSKKQEQINKEWFERCNKLEEFIIERGHRPFKVSDPYAYNLTEWWLEEREKNIKKILNKRYEERWNDLIRRYCDYLIVTTPYEENKIGKWILMYNEVCNILKNKDIFSRDDTDFINHKQWLWNQVNVSVATKNKHMFIVKLWRKLDVQWCISKILKKVPHANSRKRQLENETSQWPIEQLEMFIDKNKRLPTLSSNDSNERIMGVLLRKGKNTMDALWNDFFDKYSEYFIAEKSLWYSMFCSLKITINAQGRLPDGELYEWYIQQQCAYNMDMMTIEGTRKSWELFLTRYKNVI